MIYIKILFTYILKILFTKDEYNIKSKHFNPIRVFTILILVLFFFLSMYLMVKLDRLYYIVQKSCPAILN